MKALRPQLLALVALAGLGLSARATLPEPARSTSSSARCDPDERGIAALGGSGRPAGSPRLGRPRRACRPSRRHRYAGIDVVSLANDHTLDYGRTAFRDTLRHAHRYGIATMGGGRNLEAARRPAVLKAGGLRVAFLGFSDIRPAGVDAGRSTSGATPAFPDLIRRDVRAARARNDIVVGYFHWGLERMFTPTVRQRDFARIAFDAGATIVLGAHPHVLQPRRRLGRRLVAWSLDNFVFAAHSPGTERTGILRLKLGRVGVLDYRLRRARIVWVQPRLR